MITMIDGETMQGTLRLPLSNKVADAVNNTEPFLEFAGPDGERCFLSKHSVRKIVPFSIPRTDQLERNNRSASELDPYLVLGLSREADPASVKQAYHQLARTYHPDRFAGLELPREMHDYATAMLARINLAYRQVQNRRQANGSA